MAKEKYLVLSNIGTGKKIDHKVGSKIELDPEDKVTLRRLKSGAIKLYVPEPESTGASTAELEAEIDVLTVNLNKSEENGVELAKALEDAQAEIEKLKTELEAAKKPAKANAK